MEREICSVDALAPGEAVDLTAFVRGEERPCFVVRQLDAGAARFAAYVNVCAHRNQPVVTDGWPFDGDGLLECRAHGARYDPTSGVCVSGPCMGGALIPLTVEVRGDRVWVLDDDRVDDSVYADSDDQ